MLRPGLRLVHKERNNDKIVLLTRELNYDGRPYWYLQRIYESATVFEDSMYEEQILRTYKESNVIIKRFNGREI